MARSDSMATIDLALQGNLAPNAGGDTTPDDSSPVDPHAAPGVPAPTPIADALTPEQKKDAGKQEEKQQKDAGKQEEKLIQEKELETKQNQQLFQRSAQATASALSNVWRGTTVRLERVPTPGSIMFPLVILLVFFFVLVPVNGHTRLVWIWLTLTGNAEIQAGSGASTTTTGGGLIDPSAPGGTSTSAPLGQRGAVASTTATNGIPAIRAISSAANLSQAAPTGTFMTGVEEPV